MAIFEQRESFTAPDEVANGPNLTSTVIDLPGTSSGGILHLVSAWIAVIRGHGLPSKPYESAGAGMWARTGFIAPNDVNLC